MSETMLGGRTAAVLDRSTLDALPHVVWWTGADGNDVHFNAEGRRWFGLPETAPVEAFLALVHPDDVDAVAARWRTSVERRTSYAAHYRVRRADRDAYVWTLAHGVVIDGPDGLPGWLGINVDIDDERRETFASEQRWRAVADRLPELLAITGLDGGVEYLNATWTAYTGLTLAEVGRHGWGALVHPDDLGAVAEGWQRAILDGHPYETQYRLRRHDGAYRWFLNRAHPFRGDDGAIAFWVASVVDIDERKRREDSLRIVAQASNLFGATLDSSVALQRTAELVVESLADWCGVYVLDADGALRPAAIVHKDSAKVRAVRDYLRRYPLEKYDPLATQLAHAGSEPVALVVTDEMLAAIDDPDRRAMIAAFGLRAVLYAPLFAGEERYGIFTMANSDDRLFSEDEIGVATLIAQRASVAIGNARTYERQREVAALLQSSFLPPTLPDVPGLAFSATYTAGTRDLTIGGDWYDAFVDALGSLMFSVGDVAGRGLDAAVIMGKMRQTFRALAVAERDPARLLPLAASVLRHEHPDVFVTAFIGSLDPRTGELRYANAGHPRPLVRARGGAIAILPSDGIALGLDGDAPGRTRTHRLHAGDLLVIYTDGLIEATKDVVAGEADLIAALAHPAFDICSDPALLLRALRVDMTPSDDVAILAIAVDSPADWSFDANDAASSRTARDAFVRRLRDLGVAREACLAAEVVFGEITSNAARYTPGPIDLAVRTRGDAHVLCALDRGPGFAWRPDVPDDRLAENGRGLFLIDRLSRAVHVEHLARFGTYLEVVL